MDSERMNRWLKNIYATRDEEISCTECLDLVSHYVDVELLNQDPAAVLPQVAHHVEQCTACREEYEALRDMLRLEDDGGLPSTDDLKNRIP